VKSQGQVEIAKLGGKTPRRATRGRVKTFHVLQLLNHKEETRNNEYTDHPKSKNGSMARKS
jgi:hypothetical protein